ncbi:MAG: hypothetical protein NC340_02855 [Ruminococcus flavefaciens]|nr:hypothetical protein [Ruminococcus flavefaciens]MCM1229440.1 hypothetical protein [Ruminococcus flavefaciens]
MGFFDSMNDAVDRKVKSMAKQAPDTGLIKQILDLQQKIEDSDGNGAHERTLAILKEEADRRGLYY